METWLMERFNEKQREQFLRDCQLTVSAAGSGPPSEGWGESPEAVAAQDQLGASTPTYGFID